MLKKYSDLAEVKQEVKEYIFLLEKNKKLPYTDKIRGITKRILFLKCFYYYKGNGHYRDCMTYDLLMLMHSLTQESVRNVYGYYRSYIENFLRVSLNLEDEDCTGVRNLFNNFKSEFNYFEDDNIKILVDYLEGKYSICSQFTHSNHSANMNIYTYYTEIIENDEIKEDKLKKLIDEILTLIDKIIKFVVYCFPSKIDGAFFRKKQELKYLIGNAMYANFEESLSDYLN